MATYEIEAPNGKTYEVDGPSGADHATVIQAILAQHPEAGVKPTIGGYAKETLKAIPRGLIGGVETAVTGAAALLPEEYEKPVVAKAQELAKRFSPQAAPGYEDSVPVKIGEGLGSMGSFLIPGGLPARALMAGAMGAGEARQRVQQEGATPEQISSATAQGILPGLTDLLPIQFLLGGVGKVALTGLVSRGVRAAATGSVEALQEASQNILQNAIAQGYKPEQGLYEGTGEAASYGGAVGAIAQGLMDLALPGRARRGQQPQKEAAVGQEAPITPEVQEPIAPVSQEPVAPEAPTLTPTETPLAPEAPQAEPVKAAEAAAPAAVAPEVKPGVITDSVIKDLGVKGYGSTKVKDTLRGVDLNTVEGQKIFDDTFTSAHKNLKYNADAVQAFRASVPNLYEAPSNEPNTIVAPPSGKPIQAEGVGSGGDRTSDGKPVSPKKPGKPRVAKPVVAGVGDIEQPAGGPVGGKEVLPDALTGAAFRAKDGAVYPTGAIHDLNKLPDEVRGNFKDLEAGFVDSTGKFYTRDEAADHQLAQDKITPEQHDVYTSGEPIAALHAEEVFGKDAADAARVEGRQIAAKKRLLAAGVPESGVDGLAKKLSEMPPVAANDAIKKIGEKRQRDAKAAGNEGTPDPKRLKRAAEYEQMKDAPKAAKDYYDHYGSIDESLKNLGFDLAEETKKGEMGSGKNNEYAKEGGAPAQKFAEWVRQSGTPEQIKALGKYRIEHAKRKVASESERLLLGTEKADKLLVSRREAAARDLVQSKKRNAPIDEVAEAQTVVDEVEKLEAKRAKQREIEALEKKEAEEEKALAEKVKEMDLPVRPIRKRDVAAEKAEEDALKLADKKEQDRVIKEAAGTDEDQVDRDEARRGVMRSSKGEATTDTGHTKEGVTKALKGYFKEDSRFDALTTVVQSETDLPDVIRKSKDYRAGTRGVAYKNKLFLVADNIQRGKELGVFLHEAGAHIGFDNIMKPSDRQFLADQVRKWAKGNNDLVETKAAKAALAKGGKSNDEIIAYMTEELVNRGVKPTSFRPANTWLRRVVEAFKKAMAKIGLRQDIAPQELVDLAYGAANIAMDTKVGQELAEYKRTPTEIFNEPRFERGLSPAFKRWFGDSKAVDKNDEPLPVYHSTYEHFTVFSPSAWLSGKEGENTPYWFSEDPNYGAYMGIGTPTQQFDQTDKDFKKTNRKPMQVYISVQNPLDFRELSPDGIHTHSGSPVGDGLGSPLTEADLLRFYKQKGVKVKYTAHDDAFVVLYDEPKSTVNAKAIRAAGYDGVVMVEDNGHTTWVVYDKSKIKDVANKNPTSDPDIRFSQANPAMDAIDTRTLGLASGPSAPQSIVQRAYQTALNPRPEKFMQNLRQDFAGKNTWWEDWFSSLHGNNALDTAGAASAIDRVQASTKTGGIQLSTLEKGGFRKGANGLWEAYDTDASYKDIVEQVSKMEGKYNATPDFNSAQAMFNLAATAKREEGLMASGQTTDTGGAIKRTLNDTQLQQGLAVFNSTPEIQEALRLYKKFNDRNVDTLITAGIIDSSLAAELKGNSGYVPWFRFMQDANGDINVKAVKDFSRGLINLSKMQDLEGGKIEDIQIGNILDNMAKLSNWMVGKSIGNDTSAFMVDFAIPYGQAKRVGSPIAGGVDPKKTIQIMRNGVPTYYEMSDPAALPAFKGYEAAHGAIVSVLKAPANLLRKTITLNPIFSLAQLPQDSLRAFVVGGLKNPYAIFPRVMKNFAKELFGGTDTGRELAKYGIVGKGSGMPTEASDNIRRHLGYYDKGAGGVWSRFTDGLERISSASDEAVRTALYELTLEEGGSQVLALRRAREIINFDTQGAGATSSFLRQTVPFMGVWMNDLNNLYKGLVLGSARLSEGEKNATRAAIVYRGMQLAGLVTLYTLMVGDDDDYKKLDDDTRNRSLIVPGTGFRVPIPNDGIGFLFKVIPEEVTRAVMAQGIESDDAGAKMGRALWNGFKNIGSFENLLPGAGSPLIKTPVELILNKSFYTGNPIVGKSKEFLAPAEQYTEGTSEIAKQLGAALNLSPIKLDYLVRGLTAQVGGSVLAASNSLFHAADGKVTPSWSGDIKDIPLLGQLGYSRKDKGDLEDYYELRHTVDKVSRTYRDMIASGRGKEAIEYITDPTNQKAFALRQLQTQIDRGLAQYRNMEKLIYNNQNLDSDEMRRQLNRVEEMRTKYLQSLRLPKLRAFAEISPPLDSSAFRILR